MSLYDTLHLLREMGELLGQPAVFVRCLLLPDETTHTVAIRDKDCVIGRTFIQGRCQAAENLAAQVIDGVQLRLQVVAQVLVGGVYLLLHARGEHQVTDVQCTGCVIGDGFQLPYRLGVVSSGDGQYRFRRHSRGGRNFFLLLIRALYALHDGDSV